MKGIGFRKKISEGIFDLFYIWKGELKTILKDQAILTFLVVLPIMYPLLYAFIYTNEVVREVPAVVVDKSNTPNSRKYIQLVNATPDVNIIAHCTDIPHAQKVLKERGAYGIIYIPEDFNKNLSTGKTTQITLFCDMSGLLYYKALVMANTAVSLDFNKDIRMKLSKSTTNRQAEISASPIKYEDVKLYNPTNGFASFLIPAVLILIIQQTLLLGIGTAAGTAREKHRFKDLIPVNKHYDGTLRIVFGKGLAYFMVYILLALYVVCVVPKIFTLPQIGAAGNLILFIVPYLAACIFFAMTCSAAIRNRETSMLIFVFTSIPLLFISGISWPGAAVPEFWKYVSYIFPSTFGINGYVRLSSMGASLNEVAFEYKALWIQTGVYFTSTCFVYRHQILIARKHIIQEYKSAKERRANDEKL